MFKIFDESHAPRGVYSRKGTSFRFPMKFYETRWIEDVEVSERALKIWDLIGCHSHILGMSMEVQTTKEQQKLWYFGNSSPEFVDASKIQFFCMYCWYYGTVHSVYKVTSSCYHSCIMNAWVNFQKEQIGWSKDIDWNNERRMTQQSR